MLIAAADEFILEIKKCVGCEVLALHTDSQFSSEQNNHRALIRKNIINNYNSYLSVQEKKNIQNLDLLPRSENLFFSVSHNQNSGGFTASSFKHGFDIELGKRISEKIVTRVSTATEVNSSPDYKFLWCAKEAAYKALENSHLIISDFEISDWVSQNKTGLWCYRVRSEKTLDLKRNIGFLFALNEQILSIYFK